MSREDIIAYNERRSSAESQENGRKGGIESGKARRRKKSLKEAADMYLALPVRDTKKLNAMVKDGIPEDDADNQMAIIVGLAKKAAKGDSKAAKVLFDILAEDTAGSDNRENNNLLEAIQNTEEINTDDLPEVE